MMEVGLEGCKLSTLLLMIPGLIVWAKRCLIGAHTIRRADYLLSVLEERNMVLVKILAETEKHIGTLKYLINEGDPYVKQVLETLEGIDYVSQKKQIEQEIRAIRMAMISVGALIKKENIEEPSINK